MSEAIVGITPKQAEKMLPFTDQTIKKMCRDGELKATKLRGRWFIRPESIKELIESGANVKTVAQ